MVHKPFSVPPDRFLAESPLAKKSKSKSIFFAKNILLWLETKLEKALVTLFLASAGRRWMVLAGVQKKDLPESHRMASRKQAQDFRNKPSNQKKTQECQGFPKRSILMCCSLQLPTGFLLLPQMLCLQRVLCFFPCAPCAQ